MSAFATRVRNGERTLGAFLNIASDPLAEIVGRAGFDCVVLDAEHGPFTVADLDRLVRAADAGGAASIVRVAPGELRLAAAALDCGAAGVQLSSVESAEQATEAVRAMRYPPAGTRGVSYYTRGAAYTTGDRDELTEAGRRGPLVIAQIESLAGLEQVEGIVAVDGVDALFFGPTDYGVDVDGRADAPSIDAAAQAVVDAAKAHGRVAGTFAKGAEDARRRVDQGFCFVTVGLTPILVRGLREFVEQSSGE